MTDQQFAARDSKLLSFLFPCCLRKGIFFSFDPVQNDLAVFFKRLFAKHVAACRCAAGKFVRCKGIDKNAHNKTV